MKKTRFSGPLSGVKVIEFAGLGPAPFCSMLLSDMGADVVRIDRKEGKNYLPEDVEYRGRRSVIADLKTTQGKTLALSLISKADILIEGFRPGVMERLGLGPDVLLKLNPAIIYGRMTGWGQSGPMAHKAGHDINYLSLSGALHALGTKQKPAVPLNLVADFGGGALYLAMGLLAALHHSQKSGEGQVVDCSMSEGVISMMGMIYGDYSVDKWKDERESNVIDGGAHFYNVYQCSDGKWISLAAIEEKFYTRFLSVADIKDEAFNNQWDESLWPSLTEKLRCIFAQRSQKQWCTLFAEHDVCFTPVLNMSEAQIHPHNLHRNAFQEVDGINQPAAAPRFSKTPERIQYGPLGKGSGLKSVCQDWGIDY